MTKGSDVMKCFSCGKTVSDGARFCPYCGVDLETVNSDREPYNSSTENEIDEDNNTIENGDVSNPKDNAIEDYSNGYSEVPGQNSNSETRVFDRVESTYEAPYAPMDIDENGNEKTKNHKNLFIAIIVIGAILITAMIIFAAVVFGGSCSDGESIPTQTSSVIEPTAPTTVDSIPVEVPYLIGLTQEDAESQLEQLGLEVRISEQPSNLVEQGYVISQSPEAGGSIHRGTTVMLYISTGSDYTVSEPQIVTQPSTQAQTEPETSAETEPSDSSNDDEISTYIIPDSSERYLDYPDLEGIDGFELELARNEIYARHGRLFDTEEIQEYFDRCTWYNGIIAPEDFDESVLNRYERANIDFILQKEYSNEGED